jgi:filamentous hemagglutinin
VLCQHRIEHLAHEALAGAWQLGDRLNLLFPLGSWASGEFDMVNEPFVRADGRSILVTKRVDLRTGEPIPESGFQVAKPDSVVFRRDLGVVIDDKPIGRPLAKDQQEILRFIRAYEAQFGAPPKTIAIERYDPITMRPIVTELYKPGDFPLKKK